ncbi:hypothetical protein [Scytonema sp. NUACC26]
MTRRDDARLKCDRTVYLNRDRYLTTQQPNYSLGLSDARLATS